MNDDREEVRGAASRRAERERNKDHHPWTVIANRSTAGRLDKEATMSLKQLAGWQAGGRLAHRYSIQRSRWWWFVLDGIPIWPGHPRRTEKA